MKGAGLFLLCVALAHGYTENLSEIGYSREKEGNKRIRSTNDEIIIVEDPNVICALANTNGILLPNEKCNEFYKCFHGRPVSFKCPVNLLYNPNEQYCDWPRNVNCQGRIIPDKPEPESNNNENQNSNSSESTSNSDEDNEGDNLNAGNSDPSEAPSICAAPKSEGILIAHERCNNYYKCMRNQPVAFNCPQNLLFNPNKNYCDWPVNVDCGDRFLEKEDVSHEIDDDMETEGDHNDPSQAKKNCKKHSSDDELVAHENCNQFYKCYNKVPVALKCPRGLLYNTTAKICDWPSNVDCGTRNVLDLSEESSEESEVTESSGTGNNHADPLEAPTICAAENSDGVMVAHENCNQFYKCFEGLPVSFFCQPNLLYNPKKEYCDWQNNVDCGNRLLPETNDGEDINSAPSSQCVGRREDDIVPHENCSQFYKCLNGKSIPMDCPPGLYYNVDLKVCDWPINIDCGDRFTKA